MPKVDIYSWDTERGNRNGKLVTQQTKKWWLFITCCGNYEGMKEDELCMTVREV